MMMMMMIKMILKTQLMRQLKKNNKTVNTPILKPPPAIHFELVFLSNFNQKNISFCLPK